MHQAIAVLDVKPVLLLLWELNVHYIVRNLCLLYLCTLSASSLAQESQPVEESAELFPLDQIYPVYLANPLRSTFSFQHLMYDKSTISDAGLYRFDLKLGGVLGIYRKNSAQRIWQFTLEGGFHALFDQQRSQDNLGWNGIYGISFDVLENKKLAWRVGIHHISSHIGDEYIQRTGRTRINYTRQEVRAGIMWLHSPRWQSYAEIGMAFDSSRKVLQKKQRAELGVQYEKLRNVFNSFGLYTAIDISAYEENNWDVNTSFQIGLLSVTNERRWRFGIKYYDGRSTLGEFFQDKEKYIGIGLWIDI